jgi:hypothetical protein
MKRAIDRIPPDLGEVVAKCIRDDPRERYSTAKELADDSGASSRASRYALVAHHRGIGAG